MITAKNHVRRNHYTIGLGATLIVLFTALYLLINPLQSFDSGAVSNFPIQYPGLDGFMLAVTTIGSPIPIALIAIAWAGIEFAWNRRDRALVMIASLAAAPLFFVLKEFFHRHRPATLYAQSLGIHSYSFPSGHATMSFSVLLTLAYLLSMRLPRVWSRVVTLVLIIIVLGIGISRVYLGAHYPTDVVGGWLVGGLVLLSLRAYVAAYEHAADKRVEV